MSMKQGTLSCPQTSMRWVSIVTTFDFEALCSYISKMIVLYFGDVGSYLYIFFIEKIKDS